MYCKCHKINPNCGGSYEDSPDWIKNEKATINHINKKYNKYFQYAVTVKKDLQIIRKIKPFINKYNWEGMNFPSENKGWKKVALIGKKIAVKELSASLRGITSKNNGEFYCLNYLHSFKTIEWKKNTNTFE